MPKRKSLNVYQGSAPVGSEIKLTSGKRKNCYEVKAVKVLERKKMY